MPAASFPYIVGRMDHGYKVRQKECTEAIPNPPSHYMKQVYFDCMSFHPRCAALSCGYGRRGSRAHWQRLPL